MKVHLWELGILPPLTFSGFPLSVIPSMSDTDSSFDFTISTPLQTCSCISYSFKKMHQEGLCLQFCGMSAPYTNHELNQEGHSTKYLTGTLQKCQGHANKDGGAVPDWRRQRRIVSQYRVYPGLDRSKLRDCHFPTWMLGT